MVGWNIKWFNCNGYHHGEVHRSLRSLAKYNNGKWKSEKQRDFMYRLSETTPQRLPEDYERLFGITRTPGTVLLETDGVLDIAKGRGQVPYTVFFELDETGIVNIYRLRYKGHVDKGTAPDPERTELQWSRPQEPVPAGQ